MALNDGYRAAPDPRVADAITAPSRGGFNVALGLLAAVILYVSAQAFQRSYGPALLCSPLIVAAIVGIFSLRHPVRNALLAVLLALALAIVTFREGVICCLYTLPLVLPETIVGAVCGSIVRRYLRGRRARRALGMALLVAGIGWQAVEGAVDDPSRHPLHEARSSIVIPASPERVFAALTARELEVAPDWPWFLRVGLPMPIRMRFEGRGPEAHIVATFSQGTATGPVTEWVPGRALAYTIDGYRITDLPFHITRLGRTPSYGLRAERVDDWLTIVSTRYQLRPTAGGGTELVRHIVWRRHLGPGFYFSWLQQAVMQRGQDRLLDLIRRRVAEPPAGDAAPVLARLDRPGRGGAR